ncbi:MHYT domain-containing protein [Streptacidiphilus monticola]|uniref:MHYT domain-containing protein n=1 Tax=Streptacidiphilus monticola TaxID=2161674 RepID=A0ABW1FZS2_9ACTN
MAHIDGFTYGLVNPLLAYFAACLGAALGLRCTVRALDLPARRRRGWLLLASAAIGCGIWTMHFIAMLGFTVTNATIVYDVPRTLASLGVAVVVVGVGIFWVGHRPRGTASLLIGGGFTGLGVAAMHYLGMSAMQVAGTVSYNPLLVAASVAIAVVAATAALWMTLNVRGFAASLGAALIAGIAVVAMHYTAMTAVRVSLYLDPVIPSGMPASEFILPVAVGILVFLTVGGMVILMSPQPTTRAERGAGGPQPETIHIDLFGGR